MNKTKLWMIAATLVCGMLLAACSADDNPAVRPTTELLNDGVWTGSGEGRSGTIVVKMTVVNHEITDIVVVGAGGAGLSAAVEAASHGDLQIIVLEKQGVLGGNTNYMSPDQPSTKSINKTAVSDSSLGASLGLHATT